MEEVFIPVVWFASVLPPVLRHTAVVKALLVFWRFPVQTRIITLAVLAEGFMGFFISSEVRVRSQVITLHLWRAK